MKLTLHIAAFEDTNGWNAAVSVSPSRPPSFEGCGL